MLVLALLLAVIIGYLRGGHLRNLEHLTLRAEPLMAVALIIQFLLPALSTRLGLPSGLAVAAWILSFMLLLIAVFVNRGHLPLLLSGLGVSMNLLVILLNGGMPVLPSAIRVLVPHTVATPSVFAGDSLHHLGGPMTRLAFLADAIPIAWPSVLRSIISVGDIVLVIGVFWLVQAEMCIPGKHVYRSQSAAR